MRLQCLFRWTLPPGCEPMPPQHKQQYASFGGRPFTAKSDVY
jgi:hypothetical protein